MSVIKKKEILTIIIVSVLILLPFLNQAYHIDDWVYLTAAIQYNNLGFDSIRGTTAQDGIVFPNYYITHPLLWPLLLSFVIKIFNSTNEVIVHSIGIINLIIIGLSTLIISKKFSTESLISTLFFLFIPAVMVLSHVVMTDIPTLTFFLLAVALHIEGTGRNSVLLLILSGIAATAASGISYQALFLIFLLSFYNILNRKKRITHYFPILIPFTAFFIWCLFTWFEFGIPHPFVSFQWAGAGILHSTLLNVFPKFIGNINSIGAAAIFPAFILIFYWIHKDFRKVIVISFVLSILGTAFFATSYSLVQKTLFIIYFTTGFFVFIRILILLKHSIKTNNKDLIFLSVWFVTFFFAVTVLMPLGISRYLLPGVLPMVIIIVNDITHFSLQRFKIFATTGLALTLIWGIACSVADYNYADVYRQFSHELTTKYGKDKIWFSGDSGFRWYMEQKGFKYLLQNDERPESGNLIIIPREPWPIDLSHLLSNSKLIEKKIYTSRLPIRTLNMEAKAGFYAEVEALLPFSVSRSAFEVFEIYKMD